MGKGTQKERKPEDVQDVPADATPLDVRASGVDAPAGAEVIDAATGEVDDLVHVPNQNQLAGVTPTPQEQAAVLEGEKRAYARPGELADGEVMITGIVGTQVIIPPQFKTDDFGNQYTDEGVVLRFTDGKLVTDDENVVDATRHALEGGQGKVKAAELRRNQITILEPGKLAPPMATWDTLPESAVLNIAKAAGLLANTHAVQAALDYEKAKPSADEAKVGQVVRRDAVVAVLEGLLHAGVDAPLDNPVLPGSDITFAIG